MIFRLVALLISFWITSTVILPMLSAYAFVYADTHSTFFHIFTQNRTLISYTILITFCGIAYFIGNRLDKKPNTSETEGDTD